MKISKSLIKSQDEIKNGLVLRAVVNCYGEYWVEKVFITKRPYILRGAYGDKYFIVNKRDKYHNYIHVADLLGNGYSRLFKFSNRLDVKLSKAKDVFDFIFMITGEIIPECKQGLMLKEWNYEKTNMFRYDPWTQNAQ